MTFRQSLVVLTLVLVLGASALAFHPSAGASLRSGPSQATAAARPSTPAVTAPTAAAPGSGPLTLAEIHRLLAGRGVPATAIHVPALGAEGATAGQPVTPTYSEAPAPIGVADIGLHDVGGRMVGYEFNTSSAEGTLTLTNAQSVYVDGDGPDMYGVQLNTVLANTTLFGNSSYQFWTQNFISYTSSSGELAFGDNIWNFSSLSGLISPNVFYAHGPNGTLYAPVFYYAIGPTYTISYPFTVTFYNNATVLDDRPAVYFNYTLSNATFRTSGSYDYVIFNSSAGTPTGPPPPARFQVNGYQKDPTGLINDIELSVLGNDDGDTTTFYQLEATASIAYWNASRDAYVAVPSAMNAGDDTGETSDGAASYYTGTSPVAELRLGPSFLTGLWNTTTPPGERSVDLTLTPAAAFVLANPGTARNESAEQWVPASPSGTTTFSIPNTGSVYFRFALSEYAPAAETLGPGGANSTIRLMITLGADTADGIYTPLIAWGNAELATFAASGTGTAADPYVLYDNEAGPIEPEFDQWNDFYYPVFPGLLLVKTTAYVEVTPAPFEVQYPSWQTPAVEKFGLPSTNNLQDEFWNVSDVALLGGEISGWLSGYLAPPYPLGEVIFWNSSGNLVAGNTFYDQGSALALYGGTNNTVWGNRFLATATAATRPIALLNGSANQTGLWESENGDLIYNNYFDVGEPAYTPYYDPLSCQINCTYTTYLDRWNVTRESAAAYALVLGQNLTGSIIGTSYQGGNFWSNYGTPSNPYGVLPYENLPNGTYPPTPGQILVGGDYVPLVPFSLYPVTFEESGLPAHATWGITTADAEVLSNGSSIAFTSPNGTVPFSAFTVNLTGYLPEAPANFTVDGAPITVDVTFVPVQAALFVETGLPAGYAWNVSVNGTGTSGAPLTENSTASSLLFSLPPGAYTFVAASAGYAAVPANGSFTLTGTAGATVNLTFALVPTLTFTENGLALGTPWTVTLEQGTTSQTLTSTTGSLEFYFFDSSPGHYVFVVGATGYTATPTSGNGTLPENSTVKVAFAANPVPVTIYIVQPSCVDISVDGALLSQGACGQLVVPLAPGPHTVAANASGYEAFSVHVNVTAGHPASVYLTLVAVPAAAPAIGSEGYALIGVLAALAVIFLLLAVFFARRRPPARPPPKAVEPPMAAAAGGAPGTGPWSETPGSPAGSGGPPSPPES